MADQLSAPVYVRYLGPGDSYEARFTLGPYRVTAELAKDVPGAVPAEVADVLPQAEFERVDPVKAIEAIADADAAKAQREAEWRAAQAEVQRNRVEGEKLVEIRMGRVEAMRSAAAAASDAGQSEDEIVARALTAAQLFDEQIQTLATGE